MRVPELASYEAEAYIALLDRFAVVQDEDPELYGEISARIGELRNWFLMYPQWNLLDAGGVCRLVKTPARPAEADGLVDQRDSAGRERPLREPRDYEMLCWILWYAEESQDGQFLLSQLTERVESAANGIGETRVNWDLREQRMSLGRALHTLIAMGALEQRDGDEREWITNRAGETLFEFTELARMFQPYVPESLEPTLNASATVRSLGAALRAELVPEARVYRHLLLSTAFHTHEDPTAWELIRDQEKRKEIADVIHDAFGWGLEVTPTYAAVIRSAESPRTARNRFPHGRTASDIALLLCGEVQDNTSSRDRDAHDRVRIPGATLLRMFADLSDRYGRNWGDLGTKGPAALASEVLPVMRQASMIEGPDADDYYYVLALAARFRGEYVSIDAEYADE